MKTIFKTLAIAITAAVIFGICGGDRCLASEVEKPKLMIFFSPSCHFCIKVKQEVIPEIEKMYKDRVALEFLNIDEVESYRILLSIEEKHNLRLAGSLPIFYMGGRFINGYPNIKSGWKSFIDGALNAAAGPGGLQKSDILPTVDLVSRFKSFTPALIVGAGLLDGVNPCAFTVIVFFMSFMVMQGYKKWELIGIGLCFIFAIFVTYILIGLGVFGFFYRFEHLWIVVKVINYSIGIFCITLGFIAIHDFLRFRKTGETDGMILQLPKGIKSRIRKVIGLFGRVTDKDTESPYGTRYTYKMIVNALLTGFIVSLLEAVCTGQAYIPTISFILKTTPLKMQAVGYLLLYNLMFIVPLIAIFAFSVLGVTSDMFSKVLKKNLLLIKVLMAVSFFGFGIFLILRA